MELVLIVTAAGLIGLAVRYLVPGRASHGLAVMPSAGVIIGSVVWAVLIWAGAPESAWWSWAIALGLTLVGSVVMAVVLPRRRAAADDALWATLTSQASRPTP
jgi:hypothetical protein